MLERWVQSCRDSVSPDPSTLAPEVGIPLLSDLKKKKKIEKKKKKKKKSTCVFRAPLDEVTPRVRALDPKLIEYRGPQAVDASTSPG